MAHRSLLLMDGDPQSARVLEVSLRKAGYKVTTASRAAEGDAAIAAQRPDLVLLDPMLADGEGLRWLSALRRDAATQSLPVMVICGESAPEYRGQVLALGIDEFVQKPLYVREVLARVDLVLSRHERENLRADQLSQMSGSLSDLGFVDLLQTIDISKKSGALRLLSRGREGSLFFRDGRVFDAHLGEHHGEAALYRFLAWNQGEFELLFRPVRCDDKLGVSTQGLLMECMRRLDAWGALCDTLPPLSSVLEVNGPELSARFSDVRDEHNAVLALVDGGRTIEDVLDLAAGDDLAALQAISALAADGFLVRRGAAAPGASATAFASPVSPSSTPPASHSAASRIAPTVGPSSGSVPTVTLKPEGMLAAPSTAERTASGVRIGGVQLRRVLASALGERPPTSDVANAQGGSPRVRPPEREPAEGLKTADVGSDEEGVRNEVGAQEQADSFMAKQSKRRANSRPPSALEHSANGGPVDNGGNAGPANVIPLKVARSDAAARMDLQESARESAHETERATALVGSHDAESERQRLTLPARIDDDEHPEIGQFFAAGSAPSGESAWSGAPRAQHTHDHDEPEHDEGSQASASKHWALAIALLGAAAIGGFLVYHKLVMPTPTEFAHQPVALPTPDMLRGIPMPTEVPAAPETVPAAIDVGDVPERAPEVPSGVDSAPVAAAPVAAAPVARGEVDPAYAALVVRAQKLGFKKSAEAAFLQALTIDPDGSEALSGLAILYLNQGKNRDARARAEEALHLNPADGTAWIVLGATHSAEGDAAKAREAYAKCAAIPGSKYTAECKRMLR